MILAIGTNISREGKRFPEDRTALCKVIEGANSGHYCKTVAPDKVFVNEHELISSKFLDFTGKKFCSLLKYCLSVVS